MSVGYDGRFLDTGTIMTVFAAADGRPAIAPLVYHIQLEIFVIIGTWVAPYAS